MHHSSCATAYGHYLLVVVVDASLSIRRSLCMEEPVHFGIISFQSNWTGSWTGSDCMNYMKLHELHVN